jgi:hypothetical protein
MQQIPFFRGDHAAQSDNALSRVAAKRGRGRSMAFAGLEEIATCVVPLKLLADRTNADLRVVMIATMLLSSTG